MTTALHHPAGEAQPRTTVRSPSAATPRLSLRRYSVVGLGAALAILAAARAAHSTSRDPKVALAEVLTKRGYVVSADQIVFLDPPKGALASIVSSSRAFVIAKQKDKPDEPSEVYLVDTKLAPNGVLLDVTGESNFSNTTLAEEDDLLLTGQRLSFISRSVSPETPSSITIADFTGQKVPADFTSSDKLKNALTNYQDTGQLRGVDRHTIVLKTQDPDAVRVVPSADGLTVSVGEHAGQLAFASMSFGEPISEWGEMSEVAVARPPALTNWAVDRMRPVIGDDNMQWLKQKWFEFKNEWDKRKEELTGDTGQSGIEDDLGIDLKAPKVIVPIDPDLGWPPASLEPWVTPTLEGEGEWNAKTDTNWFRQQPNLSTTFVTTFIRTDRTRKATRVYIAMWDPRQVELHMMCGTVEPRGASGIAGPGLIPRTKDVLSRLVGASNAGFQAQHGEFGMMADGVVYLPPKPYAASIAELKDGSTAFGTWPESPVIPDNILSYRQNMTALVIDGKFNPYGRTWWGGTPPGQEDTTHTTRTGICLTNEGFVGYFYGADLSPEALAQAMIQARCKYGIALDMNAGHAGMEFYKAAPEDEMPIFTAPLGDAEGEGKIPEMEGWNFRAKKLINGMGLMHFPRYIKREGRDFFYLTLRHILPGDNLAGGNEGEGTWTVKGLPQHGFPYALATSAFHPNKGSVGARVLKVDPKTIVRGKPKDGEDTTILVVDPGGATGKSSLWFANAAFTVSEEPPSRGAARIAIGETEAATGAGVLGVHDDSGMLFYFEVDGTGDRSKTDIASFKQYLTDLGCSQILVVAQPLPLAMGGAIGMGGTPIPPLEGKTAVTLLRTEAPDGRRMFEDVPIVPKDTWYPLQTIRVRYERKHD